MWQKYGHMCLMMCNMIVIMTIIEIEMIMMMITLGMPIQLPDPSDATEQGESGTPELFRSGVLQIGVMMMMVVAKYNLSSSEYSVNGSNPE